MGRSRIGWALSVASPWCVAFAVLVSITAEAGQEPTELTSAFARSQLISAPSRIRLAGAAARPLRTVDEDGAPLPIVQARTVVGNPGELADEDEGEPNGALKQTRRAFPAIDRGAKGDPILSAPGFNAKRLNGKRSAAEPYAYKSWPRELEDPRDKEFDPGHTMSPQRPSDGDEPETASPSFEDGATPTAPLEFALNSSSPTSSDGVVVVVEADGREVGVDQVFRQGTAEVIVVVFLVVTYQEFDVMVFYKSIFVGGVSVDRLIGVVFSTVQHL